MAHRRQLVTYNPRVEAISVEVAFPEWLFLANGFAASVSGGFDNSAIAADASVSGGDGNVAAVDFASVSGGTSRAAAVASTWTAGTLTSGP